MEVHGDDAILGGVAACATLPTIVATRTAVITTSIAVGDTFHGSSFPFKVRMVFSSYSGIGRSAGTGMSTGSGTDSSALGWSFDDVEVGCDSAGRIIWLISSRT